MTCERREFYEPINIAELVEEKLSNLQDEVDYVSFVPDGEPTLDVNLGKEIDLVKELGVKTAVICNSSLIWRNDVRNDLCNADWVSVKVDAVTEAMWRRVDRPHGRLKLKSILDGLVNFAEEYTGVLTTETMLVDGFNDGDEPERVADFIREIDPDISYVALPTRPPAESWVKPAKEEAVNRAYQVFSRVLDNVEYLIGYEGNAFSSSGDFEDDILSITSVHPMREDGVRDLIRNDSACWGDVDRLISEDKLVELDYQDNRFYMRRISSRSP